MITKKSIMREIKAIKDDISASFRNVKTDINYLLTRVNVFETLHTDFYNLREELATNGVVRDLRKAEKRIEQLVEQYQNLEDHTRRQFEQLSNNGVATAINKLNAEVFKTRKEANTKVDFLTYALSRFSGGEAAKPTEEATLAGKVDAIIAHLGLDVTVAPQEVKEAKVVAKKAPTPKKKGRR